MSSLLTINHHINDANNYIQDITSGSNTHYVFASRHFPWVNANGVNEYGVNAYGVKANGVNANGVNENVVTEPEFADVREFPLALVA